MLYLNANEEKRMVFEVDIRGVETQELQGFIRFNMYGVEIGFPADIEHKKISALVPPLVEVVDREIEDGTVIEAKLELFTDRHYFKPWEGEIKVGAPMGIKAKLSGESNNTPKISTRLVSRESKESLNEFDTNEEKMLKDDEKKRRNELISVVADTLKQMGITPQANTVTLMETQKEKTKQKIVEDKNSIRKKLKNITEEGVYRYMANAGTKNPKIQKLVYEQACELAKSTEPFEVLKQVVKILKKRR
jgi:hypothetical protein